jgi:hypothetical protein
MAVLMQRMLELRHDVAGLATVLASTPGSFSPPGAPRQAPSRMDPESGLADLFGRPRPEPAPEVKLAKAPESPPLPTFPYRYFGRVQAQHYLDRDGQLIPIRAGTALPDGFEILSIDERQVIARHKSTGFAITITLPRLRE